MVVSFSGIEMSEESIVVYEEDTWGSYGQHKKKMLFIVDLKERVQKALWTFSGVQWLNNDSSKNRHRKALMDYKQLQGLMIGDRLLKVVSDYKSSSTREIKTSYYTMIDGNLVEIPSKNVRVDGKFYDLVEYNNVKIYTNKDGVRIDPQNLPEEKKVEKRWL